uniref:PDEase domain-containing protein n=1 Tax=Ditylenchus dipsaci TaxID=166011 RepID=A0A915E3N2_9BILA
MKNMLSLPEGIDKMKALCLIVHACDISHASKSWDLHSRWTEGVLEEFFRQGDMEACMGLPYSPFATDTLCMWLSLKLNTYKDETIKKEKQKSETKKQN